MQILPLLLVLKVRNGFFSSHSTQQGSGPASYGGHRKFIRNAIGNSLDLLSLCLKDRQKTITVRLSMQCPMMGQVLMLRKTQSYCRGHKIIEDNWSSSFLQIYKDDRKKLVITVKCTKMKTKTLFLMKLFIACLKRDFLVKILFQVENAIVVVTLFANHCNGVL